MNYSERNRKVARNRWRKVHAIQNEHIKENSLKYPNLRARIMGYLMGDGSVIIRRDCREILHYEIHFYPDDAKMLLAFLSALNIIYDLACSIRNYGKFYSVRTYSKRAVLDLLSIGTFGTADWRVPFDILKTDEEKREFLSSFFDCEAYVGKKAIVVQVINEAGLKDVRRLLNEFDIESRLYRYERKQKNWKTNHHLHIIGKDNRKKFLKRIGFNHSKKQKALHATVA